MCAHVHDKNTDVLRYVGILAAFTSMLPAVIRGVEAGGNAEDPTKYFLTCLHLLVQVRSLSHACECSTVCPNVSIARTDPAGGHGAKGPRSLAQDARDDAWPCRSCEWLAGRTREGCRRCGFIDRGISPPATCIWNEGFAPSATTSDGIGACVYTRRRRALEGPLDGSLPGHASADSRSKRRR